MKDTAFRCVLFSGLMWTILPAQAADSGLSEVTEEAQQVLKSACYRCHGDDGTVEGGFSYALDREQLVSRGQIVPKSAAKSRLIRRVQNQEMPPEGEPSLTTDQIEVLVRWVDAGAPDFNKPRAPREFITAGETVRAMAADIAEREAGDRKSTRFITLTHLYNAGRSDDEIRSYHHGIAKLVNSLSWGRNVVLPKPIDSQSTILRIDIRDYKWSAAIWDQLAAADPYALTYAGAEAKKLYTDSGCAIPYVRGDWFVAAAARPPLYHDILQLPATDKELETLLRVDVEEDLRTAQAVRAGFNGSAVSRNNRLIERHESSYGYYWKSYDFAKNSDRKNLFSHPLGPGKESSDFAQDGGELIFSLPNGFQGYMLVDADGRRIDKGPTDIVSDPKQPDRAVENGLSCMSCHVRGILPKSDQVRPHVEKNPNAFSQTELDAVLALYLPDDRFQTILQEDAQKFRAALERAEMPAAISEPIQALATLFEKELDLKLAAAEAALKPDEFEKLLSKSPSLARELGSLQTTGGTVQRETFTTSFATLARTAKIGTPPKVTTTLGAVGKTATSGKSEAEAAPKAGKDGWVELGGERQISLSVSTHEGNTCEQERPQFQTAGFRTDEKGRFSDQEFQV